MRTRSEQTRVAKVSTDQRPPPCKRSIISRNSAFVLSNCKVSLAELSHLPPPPSFVKSIPASKMGRRCLKSTQVRVKLGVWPSNPRKCQLYKGMSLKQRLSYPDVMWHCFWAKMAWKSLPPKYLLYGRGILRIYSTEVMLAQIKNWYKTPYSLYEQCRETKLQ